MKTYGNQKTISRKFAIAMIILVAAAGAAVAYYQYDLRQKYIAASEQAFATQEEYVNSVFDRIESNLAMIRERESLIQQNFNAPENYGSLMPEERIQHEIDFIDHLIRENNELIASLNEQIKTKDSRIKGYESTVKDLKARIGKYQDDLNVLLAEKQALQKNLDETSAARDRLAANVAVLDDEVARKSAEIKDQQKTLEQQDQALHTAYYTIGTYKSLRDSDIIQKEGGFLGINRMKTLTDDPDTDLFHEIDRRKVTRIPVMAEKWEMVTGHDPASYELELENNRVEWINIKDPDKFWKKSKYLVIVVRDPEFSELASSR